MGGIKKEVLFLLLATFTLSCSNATETTPIFDVVTELNVTYAKGLSHQSVNSPTYTVMDLKLDIYKPKNDSALRPAIVLFHGGGLVIGSRTDPNIVNLAKYFASRGWIAFSVSYRLYKDKGTIPEAWVTYAKNNLPTNQYAELYKVYPAHRDAKAALRWIMANAALYRIDTNRITVGGGSAGAVISNAIGITEPEDYTNEIPVNIDPTVSTIHKEQLYKVHTILDFWGSGQTIDILKDIYGVNRYGANDVPMFIVHGTADTEVKFSYAEALRDNYIKNGVDYVFYPLKNEAHGAWNAKVNGKRLESLALDFIVSQQNIHIEKTSVDN